VIVVVVELVIFVPISFPIIVLVVRLLYDAVQQRNVGHDVALSPRHRRRRRGVWRPQHPQLAENLLLDDVSPVDVTAGGFPAAARATLARGSPADVTDRIRATGSDAKLVLGRQTAAENGGDGERRANATQSRHRNLLSVAKIAQQYRTPTGNSWRLRLSTSGLVSTLSIDEIGVDCVY